MLDYHDYKIGDDAWVWLSNHQGNMTKGKVIHSFDIEYLTLYVVEIETSIDSLYECRSGHWLEMRPERPEWQEEGTD
jgi:hypothetical protein